MSPGGFCRPGPKAASMKHKLPASTNYPFCPLLRSTLPDSNVLSTVQGVYEFVFNGIDTDTLKKATSIGVAASAKVPGVVKITAVNFGGKTWSVPDPVCGRLEGDFLVRLSTIDRLRRTAGLVLMPRNDA
jgi:formylmethanofuran:tetrahydromethanopterin formyltransferase